MKSVMRKFLMPFTSRYLYFWSHFLSATAHPLTLYVILLLCELLILFWKYLVWLNIIFYSNLIHLSTINYLFLVTQLYDFLTILMLHRTSCIHIYSCYKPNAFKSKLRTFYAPWCAVENRSTKFQFLANTVI